MQIEQIIRSRKQSLLSFRASEARHEVQEANVKERI
jgi:hypothetical protein